MATAKVDPMASTRELLLLAFSGLLALGLLLPL
jgi:hypothetical protein